MTFDIRQKIFDRDGVPIEKKARQYQDELIQLFKQSPEGEAIRNEGVDGGWFTMVIDFGINYLGVTPPHMTPSGLREILFDIFPRKVSTTADEAPNIIRELQAFWQFLQREFHLENAAACLKVLDEKAARELKKKLSDPANFGFAKSFFMQGLERGFDMTTEEGMNKWMETYNAELATGVSPHIPFLGEQSQSTQKFQVELQPRTARRSRKKHRNLKWN
ncbi:MAG TPA: hypothetical protein VNG51_08745 [Ktedonobacteraceae bacterium]|nr:hypothetical protein [Ktedonobacteraceae bacterium]